MTPQIQTQYFLEKPIRFILDEKENPWFIAMDISDILDYTDTQAMTRKLDDDEIQNRRFVGFGNRGVSIINESGLYSSILSCEKPQAKPFKKWVTNDVLPSIRRNGKFSIDSKEIEQDKKYIQSLYKELESLESANKANNKRIKEIRAIVKEVSTKDYSQPSLFNQK